MKLKYIIFAVLIPLIIVGMFAVSNYSSTDYEAPVIEERSNSEKLTNTLLATMEALKVAREDLAKAQDLREQAELIEADYKELESLAYADYLNVVVAIKSCSALNWWNYEIT